MILRYITLVGSMAALPACERPKEEPPAPPGTPAPEADRPTILFLGTSLTAGLGVDPEQAYPALIQKKIEAAGMSYRVVNAGVSGETSAGALRRVDWLFRQPVSVLVVETGANDGLRGLSTDSLRANIQGIFDRAKRLEPPPQLVLIGMRVPPNYGRSYSMQFESLYRSLAQANHAVLVPFLLEGVGGVSSLNQADGIHPTPAGQRIMAETVWRVLEPVLKKPEKRSSHDTRISRSASTARSISSLVL
jgi:acyl-CoA thioesterase-1